MGGFPLPAWRHTPAWHHPPPRVTSCPSPRSIPPESFLLLVRTLLAMLLTAIPILPGPAWSCHTETMLMSARLVKLPQPFWKEMPIHWFQIAEATFALHKIISDETKYRYVLTNLDSSIISFVADLIANTPSALKYETLKAQIVNSRRYQNRNCTSCFAVRK